MQAGKMKVKIVIRRLQGNKAAYQFILLAGFTPTLTHATADYMETLSSPHILQQSEIDGVVAKLQRHSNAASVSFITNKDVQKKIDKLFAQEGFSDTNNISFSDMRIGQYM